MIGNNNFYFNYNNFLLNNNSFISPSQNVGINNIPKKSDNTSKTNVDNSTLSFDLTHTDSQDKSIFNNFSNSLSDFAGLSNTQNGNKHNTQQLNANDIFDKIDNLSTKHDDKTYKDAIKEVDKYRNNIINSANNCGINSGLLYGVLIAEKMRVGAADYLFDSKEGASKGLSQIKVDSAIQGEMFFRQNHNLPPLTDNEISKLKENLNKDLNDPNKQALNIDYAAKYISFLQHEFPIPENAKPEERNKLVEEQNKLIAAAYKAGPEVVKNARMQEQLNDLLLAKLNNEEKIKLFGKKGKLTTDGYMGGDTSETKTAILSLINNYFNDPKLEYKRGTILKNIDNPDIYRAIIDDLWQTWAKKNNIHENPIGSVPESYIKDPDKWREDVPLSVEDVIKAQRHFQNR